MLTPANRGPVPLPLRRRWVLTAVAYTLALLGLHQTLSASWGFDYANKWAFTAALALGLLLWLLHRYLPLNHAPDGITPRATLGPGNALTLLRGGLVGLMTGFLFLPSPPGWLGWLPAALYTASAFIDLFDGFAARRAGHATRLGEVLDVEFDALSVLLVAALVVWYGKLPWWFLLLATFRYLYMLGLHARARRGLPNAPSPPSVFRRAVAGVFMSFLTVLLWPIVRPPGTTIAAIVFCLPYTAIFLRDWLVASHAVDLHAPAYRRFWLRPVRFAQTWLPLVLRALLLGLLLLAFANDLRPAWTPFLQTGFHLTAAPPLLAALNTLTLLAILLVVLGILPHFTALWLILAAAADILGAVLTWPNALLLAAACALALLGGGRFALWQPDHHGIFHHRMGENQGAQGGGKKVNPP
ncbi:MAG: CDP-alcohol phosphatidyltransferase family protein [Ardenticatenales bacterium]|nr:CDP-alcohol phosphatidyltransferase family protein [Ardenticatenales bacterium]